MKQPRPRPREDYIAGKHAIAYMVDPHTFELNRVFVRAHGLPKGSLMNLSIERYILIERHRNGVQFE